MRVSDCVFCKIVAGEIKSERLFEDEQTIAIRDANPQAPIHILVISKEHIESLMRLPSEKAPLIGHMGNIANELARHEELWSRGYRLVINAGPEGGQSVPHLHLHLMGGRPMLWPPG
ncbi:MAG: histidine triad nucleotide-binding protein [Dehalococcoidia bacterium]|nr:histidine triad nucleotide-binding protein [Dehalococcoidia bacterium]